MKKSSSKPVLLVELKWNKPVDAAIAQIHKQYYPSALKGLPEEILLAGISYDPKNRRHTCRIERCIP